MSCLRKILIEIDSRVDVRKVNLGPRGIRPGDLRPIRYGAECLVAKFS